MKDLSLIGRDAKDTVIIESSPFSYRLQPEQALPISCWHDPSMKDRQLQKLIPVLVQLSRVYNCKYAIKMFVKDHKLLGFGYAVEVCATMV